MSKNVKDQAAKLTRKLLADASAAAERHAKEWPVTNSEDLSTNLTPWAWKLLRDAYRAGFLAGAGKGFKLGLESKGAEA